MQCWTRGCLLEHTVARCVSIYKCIKNLSVKTDNWLIGATATRLEVKGMYTSQKYSSLVLIDWDSTLCFQSGQDHAAKLKERRKNKQAYENATPTRTSNVFTPQNNVCGDWLVGKKGLLTCFSSLFLHDVVSGLSAIARMELCDTAWPLTFCDELWVYLLRLLISTCDSQDWETIKRMTNIQTETDISTDRLTERQADRQRRTDRQIGRGRLWWELNSESRAGMQKGGLTGQVREQE